jgi:hypothetical protein
MDVMELESVMSTAIPQSKDCWQRERNNNEFGKSFPKMGCLVGVESYQG